MAEVEPSILLVDDDADDLVSLKKALGSIGCTLHAVSDPHGVVPAVRRERPDVVVMDALLPGLSGFDLCKQIKTDEELKGTRVVIITGVYLRQQYRQEALQQFKADGFLTKPFRPPELQRLVVELLAKKTRNPPSRFLGRLSLPSSGSAPKKRGLFGRLFGKTDEAATLPKSIAPVARRRTPSPAPRSSQEARSETFAPEPVGTARGEGGTENRESAAGDAKSAPKAVLAEKDASEAERGRDGVSAPDEAELSVPTGDDRQAEPTPLAPEQGSAPVRSSPAPPGKSVASVETEAPDAPADPRAADALDAPPETDAEEGVEWTDEGPPPVAREAPAAEVAREGEKLPEAESSKRPRFRVGDVPVYEEEEFYTELKRELSKCRRVDRPLTLILIRVDDLLQIVEVCGKKCRESVLWHVAEQAMGSLREVDLVGMLSSEDLVALAAFASDKYGGGRVVSRMRRALQKKPFHVGDELPSIVPKVVFGMASYPEDGDDVSGLMEKAKEDLTGR